MGSPSGTFQDYKLRVSSEMVQVGGHIWSISLLTGILT